MNVLLFLVPTSLVLLLVAVWVLRWAVRKGQFENLDAAAIDILRDDSADQPPVTTRATASADGADAAAPDPAGMTAPGDARVDHGRRHAD